MKRLKDEKKFDDNARKQLKYSEDETISKIAQVLVLIAKEISHSSREKELKIQPSFKIKSGSVFYLDSKSYERNKNNGNRVFADENK